MKKRFLFNVFLLLGMGSVNIARINLQFPQIPVVETAAGDWIYDFPAVSEQVRIIDFHILNQEELQSLVEKSGGDFADYQIPDILMKGAVVTLETKNMSLAERSSLKRSPLVAEAFSNDLHLPLTELLNQNEQGENTCKLLYLLTDNRLSKNHWDKIADLNYYLVLSYTPIEHRLLLAANE